MGPLRERRSQTWKQTRRPELTTLSDVAGVPWWQAARRRSRGEPWRRVVRRTMAVNPPASEAVARHNLAEYTPRKKLEERRLRQRGRDTLLIWSEYPVRVERHMGG